MEIEAKFTVPSRRVYRRLARLRAVAGYALIPTGAVQVTDRYFDTRDGRLLAAGYACRLRREGVAVIATLKGLDGAEGAVHRRVEEEVRLAEWSPRPGAWPESPARSLALGLLGDALLEPLFDLTQDRARSDVLDGERRVAQLSLDSARLILTGLRRPARSAYHELEVELTADGQEADLAAIAGELASTWGLSPEPRSKFERGLAFLRERQAALSLSLTPEERAALQAHASAGDSPYAHRAAALLNWDAGLPLQEVMARSGLSAGRVHYWVRAFSARRLGILGASAAHGAAQEREDTPLAKPVRRLHTSPTLLTVKQFCAGEGVDVAHVQATAAHADLLFDALAHIHQLPKKRRRLLRSAALLATIGAAIDTERPGQAGRDLILAQPLRDVSTAERLALACIVAFCYGKVRVDREPTLAALDEKLRRHVMATAALVRVAEALDFSRTQATQIETITEPEGAACEIVLAGPSATLDAAQASSRADLWFQLFKQELIFTAAQPPSADLIPAEGGQEPEQSHEPAEEAAASPAAGMPQEIQALPAAGDPMSEAGRKILTVHFQRMLANEAGTRLGEDPEALHDMRVATRRMRAAFALFAPYFDEKTLKPFGKGLRQAGRTLGAVRDLDVLLEKARDYATALPPERAGALDLLLAHWETARDMARRQMLEYLDEGAYRRFVAEFGVFLATPGAGALPILEDEPVPFQVRHVVPRVILTRYESVRAYERLLPGAPLPTYHALRIECKGLRYALEFFREVLGEEAPALIKQVTALQDLLGNLQDAHIAEALLTGFLEERSKRSHKRSAEISLAGVEAYLEFQRDRQAELVASFPVPWAELVGVEFRRRLALVVAAV